jgi:PAS domain S-box-containing protein
MQGLLAWFVHPAIRDRDDLRRARLVIAACGIASAIALLIAAMQAAWGIWQSAALCAATALGAALLPFGVKRTGRWRAVAAVLCGLIWLAACAIALLTLGAMVAALYYMIFASALAAAALGLRSAIGFAVATLAVVVACYAGHALGLAAPIAIEPEVGLRSAVRGAAVFILAMAALVAAYEALRNAALQDIAESERRYRALADYGPDVIAELDFEGRILYGSAQVGDADKVDALRAVHRDDRPALAAAVRQLEVQPSVRVGPLRWMTTPARVTWFEAALTRFRAERQDRILVVARDVTQRIELEQQFRQSQKMQAVGQLASGLAHDFNNLLMIVSGNAESLSSRANADASLRTALDEILRVTEQGAALTRQLVSLARPVQGARGRIDMNATVRDNERMLRVLIGESCNLLLELSPAEVPIRANGEELAQVLVNLAANARDAMRPGGTLRIATVARAGRATLVVHDNGSGIDPSTREHMFEPFFTTKPPGRGAGLGLYVVYSVVTSLGGEVHVTSELGAGTRITLEFPLAAAPAGIAAVAAPRPASGRGERILVVEDRPEVRALVSTTLIDAGYAVTLAADGLEALALESSGPVDLVVSDVVMPRMGGIELVRVLREKRPSLRAVFLSGHPGELGTLPARAELLRKPFRAAELLAAVRDQLGGR